MRHGVASAALKVGSECLAGGVVAELGEDEDLSVVAKKPRRQLLDLAATSMSDVQRDDAPVAC